MPIHEFTCKECGHFFEELVRGSEKIACPKCESTQVGREFSVISSPAKSASSCEAGDAGMCPPAGCCAGGACPHSG